jgi:hypothetical protein
MGVANLFLEHLYISKYRSESYSCSLPPLEPHTSYFLMSKNEKGINMKVKALLMRAKKAYGEVDV